MTVDDLKNRYKAARVTLFAMIMFIVVDAVILSFSADANLLFVMVIPQLAIAFARYYFSGGQAVLLVVLFVLFPLMLYIICHILSKKQSKWLVFATIMAYIDFVVLFGFVMLYGFELQMIIDVFVEVCILYYLTRGCSAGKKLNGDLVIDEQEEEKKFEEANAIIVKTYRYDKQLAKQNGTNKGWNLVLAFFGLLAVLVISIFIIGALSTYSRLSTGVLTVVAVALLSLDMIGYIRILNAIRPYTYAKNIQYYIHEGKPYQCFYEDVRNAILLEDLTLIKKTDKEFICYYTNSKGRAKKLVIPNCYPNIQEIMKENGK